MTIHLITFALALAAVVAFRIHPSPTHAFMPRRYAIAAAIGIAVVAGAMAVAHSAWAADVVSVAPLVGVCGLFLAYPSIQARRKQPIKPSVMLALAACLVFGAYLLLSQSMESAHPGTALPQQVNN